MDLSGIIFVALAAGWALYLIPKALQQHDELARSRSVEDFSHRMRVLGRGLAGRGADVDPGQRDSDRSSAPGSVADPAPATPSPADHEGPAAPEPHAVPEPVEGRPHPGAPYRVTRAAARRAASRRRRVLLVLLLALAGTAAAAWPAYLPWWSVTVPGGLIVAFLVIARLSVRREEKRRRPQSVGRERHASQPAVAEEAVEPADREDTVGVAVDDLAAIQEEPLPDDGALWDPLPLNLPTYVGKPHARRTVRTIELTGMTSSGHDPADTALARRADAEQAQQVAETGETAETAETEQRRAVGE